MPGFARWRVRLQTRPSGYVSSVQRGGSGSSRRRRLLVLCSSLPFGGETEDYFIEVVPGDLLPCPEPSDVTVEQEDAPTSATVSWLHGGDENQWELVYGLSGFDPDNEEPVVVFDNPTVLISDLETNADYGVYVRSICENNTSDWTELTTFITGSVSVSDIMFQDFSYFPNPAEDKLTLNASVPIEEITIVNVTGQKLLTLHPSIESVEVDISRLSSGIYFTRVTLNQKSKVYKFIKK